MKKTILSTIFLITSFCSMASYTRYVINAGGTVTIAPQNIVSDIVLVSDGSPLLADFTIQLSSLPANGVTYRVWLWLLGMDISTYDVTVFGVPLQQIQTSNKWGYFDFIVVNGTQINNYSPRFSGTNFGYASPIEGDEIAAGTLPLDRLEEAIPLSAWDTLGRGRIIRGGGSNVAESYNAAGNAKILIGDGTDINSKSVSGDVSITNAGVVAIDSVIVDADIKTGAAIKWQKLATGTASYVAVTNSSGVLTTEQYLQPVRGGTGINTNASNGFATVNAGTWSVGTLTDVRGLDNLSFVTANQGIYYLYFPFAATATNINCRVTSVISGTDDGSLTIANNSGTVMAGSSLTAGVLTIAASAVFGTGYSSTLTSNNTFTAGQSLQLTTSKTTSGGVLHCDVTYTRTQ